MRSGDISDVRRADARLAVRLAECAPLAVSSMAQGDFGASLKMTGGLRFEERDLRGATSGGLSWLEGQHCGGEGGGFEVLGMGRIEV